MSTLRHISKQAALKLIAPLLVVCNAVICVTNITFSRIRMGLDLLKP
jgi:hypothetical protein